MTEAELGRRMKEQAWREGHRPRLPEVVTTTNFAAATGDSRRQQFEKKICEVLRMNGRPMLIEHVSIHFPDADKYAVENALRRLKTSGKVQTSVDITVAKGRIMWGLV